MMLNNNHIFVVCEVLQHFLAFATYVGLCGLFADLHCAAELQTCLEEMAYDLQ